MNSKHRHYDVIIIGAGPAGASSAYFLSQQFERVLLVDAMKFPREKLCGGLLADDVLRHLKEYWDVDPNDSNLGLSFSSGNLLYHKEQVKLIETDLVSFNMVMRADFDHFLVKKAIAQGVEFIDGTRVTNIDPLQKTLKIKDMIVGFDRIVAADGIPSFVSRVYGLSHYQNSDIKKNTAFAYEIHVPKKNIKRQELFERPWIFFGDTKGYGWTFPKDNILSVGIGAIGKDNISKTDLKELFDYLNIEFDNQLVKGHYIPYGYPKTKSYRNSCYLVGDAANLCDPTTAKGIGYALESSRLLAEAIVKYPDDNEKSGKAYEKLIRKEITSDLKYGMRINWFLIRNRFIRLGMHVLRNSESVGEKTLLLVAGRISFREYYWTIIKRLPKYSFQLIRNKIRGH